MFTEPVLQPLPSEVNQPATANLRDEAQANIRAAGFWTCGHARDIFRRQGILPQHLFLP